MKPAASFEDTEFNKHRRGYRRDSEMEYVPEASSPQFSDDFGPVSLPGSPTAATFSPSSFHPKKSLGQAHRALGKRQSEVQIIKNNLFLIFIID